MDCCAALERKLQGGQIHFSHFLHGEEMEKYNQKNIFFKKITKSIHMYMETLDSTNASPYVALWFTP